MLLLLMLGLVCLCVCVCARYVVVDASTYTAPIPVFERCKRPRDFKKLECKHFRYSLVFVVIMSSCASVVMLTGGNVSPPVLMLTSVHTCGIITIHQSMSTSSGLICDVVIINIVKQFYLV